MVKISIVGQEQARLQTIKKQLQNIDQVFDQAYIATFRSGDMGQVFSSKLDLLIFDTQHISQVVFPFVAQVRKLGHGGPILILGHKPKSFDIGQFVEVKNLHFLKKPYDVDQLLGIVKNCINVHNMRLRKDERFDVREQATLEAYSSEFKTETVINNISRSGVRIEGNLAGLSPGDLLKLNFNFDKIKKERTMSARVVWKKDANGEADMAGLEFISQKTVYEYLLNYATA